MRYHIDTIPIWDAFREGGECPLCILAANLEASMTEMYLGGSVMEPDTRIAVNARGFCARHARQLFDEEAKLPLALLYKTRLDTLLDEISPFMDAAEAECGQGRRSKGRGPSAADKLLDAACRQTEGCVICSRMDEIMDRYVDTILAMWQKDMEFQKCFNESKGFCLSHFTALLAAANHPSLLTDRRPMMAALCALQKKALERLQGEIDWFTRKFDYRNTGKPWGDSKDALPRTITKLRGYRADMPGMGDGKEK